MPAIKRLIAAATENALATLRFTNPARPSLVSLWASTPTVGEDLSFGVGELLFGEALEVNLEIANQAVDVARDQLLFREPVPAGQMVLSVPVVTADFSYQMNIESL